MTSVHYLSSQVLPHFERAVLAGHTYTYGHYADAIGRNSAKESMVIGKVMHMIGAVCVLTKVPIAPLFFVQRADGEWRGVFESNYDEKVKVLPHYDNLYVIARDYKYTQADFARIRKALESVLPKYFSVDLLTPHELWKWILTTQLENNSTPWGVALDRYYDLLSQRRKNAGHRDFLSEL